MVHYQVGIDPVDVVKGEITKKNANGTRWGVDDTKSFNKTNVRSGTIVSWTEDINVVSDYFEFDLTVIDNGVPWYYDGGGRDQRYQRYNFEVDRYKDLDALGGQRHHFVSATPLRNAGFNSNYAPCIRMLAKDHFNTPSYGSPGVDHRNQEEK